jgi:multidrug efflux pump subunit AcrA (membrane-fusion protein)
MTRRHYPLAALALLAVLGCGEQPPAAPTGSAAQGPVTVTTAPVVVRAVPRSITAVGTLQAYDDATISPKVGGPVLRTYVDLGDVVLPGQVLLEIDPKDYRTEVERARRALTLELARLGLSELVSPHDFKPEDVPAVKAAQVRLEGEKLQLEKVVALVGASKQERDLAQTAFNVAEAAVRVATTEARAGLTAAWLRQDELDAALIRLADCTVTVPVPTGWAAWSAAVGPAANPIRYSVALKFVTEGERVETTPATRAFRLLNDRALKFPALLPERHANEVKVGQFVEVRADAAPGRVVRGWIYRISAAVDPTNRTFPVVVAVPNLDGALRAGGFARASVLIRTDPAVRTVPPTAVVSFAGVTKVFVIEGDKARAVEVTLGTREKDWVEVIGAIPDGAKVATTGHSQLVDGSPVKLRDEAK